MFVAVVVVDSAVVSAGPVEVVESAVPVELAGVGS